MMIFPEILNRFLNEETYTIFYNIVPQRTYAFIPIFNAQAKQKNEAFFLNSIHYFEMYLVYSIGNINLKI